MPFISFDVISNLLFAWAVDYNVKRNVFAIMLKGSFKKIKEQFLAANPYLRTLYVFNAFSLFGSTIYGLYYGIFLYKNTFSLSVLAIDGLLGSIGVWFGYILGVGIIKRFGYGVSLRSAFAIWAAVAFITAMIAGEIAQWFMVVAIAKALPMGIFTAAGDTIMLRDVANQSRSGFIQVVLALEFVTSIILPSLIGAGISLTGGYEWAFISAGIVYSIGIFIPCTLAVPKVSFNAWNVIRIFDRPLYKHHALNRTASAGFNQLNAFVLTIVPFLILQNELSVGILTSVTAFIAAMVALTVRKVDRKHHLRLGYSAYTVRAFAAYVFITFWTAPLMIIWQLIGKLVTPLHDPLQRSIDIHNDSLIMGDEVRDRALEINFLNNTLVLIGSVFAFGSFLLITQNGINEQRQILQVLIMCYAAWRFVNLAISTKINRWAMETVHIPVRVRLLKKLKITA